MPQENLNKIWKAGKLFEEAKPEQPTKEPTPDETKPSNVKRKISVVGAFIEKKEDPFKKKVEAVLRGVELASASATAGEEEKPVPADAEVVVGTGQDEIGEGLVAGKSIRVEGDAGDVTGRVMSGGKIYVEGNTRDFTGNYMSGGEIHVKGNAGKRAGYFMSGGLLRIDGDVVSFDVVFISSNKGTIIWKGEKIWENGQKVEPGWTNLNVKDKRAK